MVATGENETHNEFSGKAENLVQARDIGAINNYLGQESNGNLSLTLVCDEELELEPGDQVPLTVEISNLKDAPYDVSLHVNGMPGTESAIVPDVVTIEPRGDAKVKLVLCTSATAPEAGRRSVTVYAEDRFGRRLAATSKTVVVLSKPDLAVCPMLPADLSESGTYRGAVELKNTGNKPLEGTLHAPGEFGEGAIYRLDLAGSGYFELAPDDSALVDVELRLGAQPPFTMSWEPQFAVEITRGGKENSTHEFTLVQTGWVTRLPARLIALLALTRARVAQFVAWCGKEPTTRRGVLLTVAGIAVVLSSMVTAGLDGAPTAPTGSTASSVPSTNAAPSPQYSVMVCAPGTSAINLWGMTEAEAQAHAAWLVEFESSRMGRLPVEDARFVSQLVDLYHPQVQVSRWKDACSPFRGPERAYAAVFVWFGPLPSNQVEHVCEMLHKYEPTDCQTGSTTER